MTPVHESIPSASSSLLTTLLPAPTSANCTCSPCCLVAWWPVPRSRGHAASAPVATGCGEEVAPAWPTGRAAAECALAPPPPARALAGAGARGARAARARGCEPWLASQQLLAPPTLDPAGAAQGAGLWQARRAPLRRQWLLWRRTRRSIWRSWRPKARERMAASRIALGARRCRRASPYAYVEVGWRRARTRAPGRAAPVSPYSSRFGPL